MNESVVRFTEIMYATIPGVKLEIETPKNESTGTYFINIYLSDFYVEISYIYGIGFGVYTDDDLYGQRPDEIYKSEVRAARRVAQLMKNFEAEGVLKPMGLADLRVLLEKSQASLAQALSVKQPSIQRIEQRRNIEIATLARHIRALGGRLEISAVFEDMETSLDLEEVGHKKDSSLV